MNLGFTYAGVVESNIDPLRLGRLKVRVPHVFGSASAGSGYIGTNDLPWALPAGLPAGSSAKSGGLSHLPENGDKVWVRFLDGEPEKPIWEWGMQSVTDADTLALHSYSDIGIPSGKPDRAFWTRYSHAFEMNLGSVIMTTSQGYRIVLTDSSFPGVPDGDIMVTTQKGNFLKLSDLDDSAALFALQDVYYNVGAGVLGLSETYTWNTLTGDYDITSGNQINLSSAYNFNIQTSSNLTLAALGDMQVATTGAMAFEFSALTLGLGATESAVLGNRLVAWVEALYLWLSLHTHISSTAGSPTSPPPEPIAVSLPQPSTFLSTSILLQD